MFRVPTGQKSIGPKITGRSARDDPVDTTRPRPNSGSLLSVASSQANRPSGPNKQVPNRYSCKKNSPFLSA